MIHIRSTLMNTPFKSTVASLLCFLFLSIAVQADTPLEKKMDAMKKQYKELSKSLEAPVEEQKEKYQKSAETLRDLMKESRTLSPEKAETIPADKRAAFIEGYQKAMDQSITTLDNLIKAIQASNWTEAKAEFNKLKEQQKEGHKEYRSEKP